MTALRNYVSAVSSAQYVIAEIHRLCCIAEFCLWFQTSLCRCRQNARINADKSDNHITLVVRYRPRYDGFNFYVGCLHRPLSPYARISSYSFIARYIPYTSTSPVFANISHNSRLFTLSVCAKTSALSEFFQKFFKIGNLAFQSFLRALRS